VFKVFRRRPDRGERIYLTDPPYGDAVKREILDFFIAWLRKILLRVRDMDWDSRGRWRSQGRARSSAAALVAAYRRMTEAHADNGIQVIMFTTIWFQSGPTWRTCVWARACRHRGLLWW